jgi:hypothetical protein
VTGWQLEYSVYLITHRALTEPLYSFAAFVFSFFEAAFVALLWPRPGGFDAARLFRVSLAFPLLRDLRESSSSPSSSSSSSPLRGSSTAFSVASAHCVSRGQGLSQVLLHGLRETHLGCICEWPVCGAVSLDPAVWGTGRGALGSDWHCGRWSAEFGRC